MGTRHTSKQVALTVRHHTLMLQVRRALRKLGYEGIQTTGYTDMHGARLVEHDLIVYGVYVCIRAYGHRPQGALRYLLETDANYYLQCGATDLGALVERLTVARARHMLPRAVHWSTVGTDDE